MRLTKHHGLGNDFLVALDVDDVRPLDGGDAVALCDRQRGIGADGLIRVTAGTGGADVTMTLFNADGSRAEMSGNGIRCLTQAVFQAGLAMPPTLSVMTDAGVRTVTVHDPVDLSTQRISVDMGPAKVGDDEPDWLDEGIERAARVDLGNPHLVLLGGPGAPDVSALGPHVNALVPGGINVEVVQVGATPGTLDMTVFERGVGVTLACGTGACAAAAAAHAWDQVPAQVVVRMPGGEVTVELADTVTLTGPSTSVARIDTPWP